MGHLFISYSHEDKEYVHKLRKALQQQGFEVWIDDRIDYGTEWQIVIQDQIDTCQAFILVATENSYRSKWVQREVTRAQRINKEFFPLLLSGNPWLTIEATQYVDVRDKSLPPDKFYSRLAAVAPIDQPEPSTPTATITYGQPRPDARANWSRLWNPKIKAIATRISIAAAIFMLVVIGLFGLGNILGLINTDNSPVTQSSQIFNLVTSANRNNLSNTYTFSNDQPIYVLFNPNVRALTTYESKWYYIVDFLGTKVNVLVAKSIYVSDFNDSSIYFELTKLPMSGSYRVDIYKSEELIGRRYFAVD